MSIIVIVELIAEPIERRHDDTMKAEGTTGPTLTCHYTGSHYVAASQLRLSLATFGFAGTLTAIYRCTNPRFNVAPETSPNIPVIVHHKGGNECRLIYWELIPHWAADPWQSYDKRES
jgi:hypothetical protein